MPGTYGKERKRYMDKQLINVKMKKILIVLVVFLGIILTVLGNSYRIAKEMTKQLYQNLEDVANQNALALHNTVHGNYLLLEGLSDNLRGATPEDIEERLDLYEDRMEQKYRNEEISREEYRAEERKIEALEDRLDQAEDTLEAAYGIKD